MATDRTEIAKALSALLTSQKVSGANGNDGNLVDAFAMLSKAITDGARHLGVNDAMTPMGAIELLSLTLKEGATEIADSIYDLAKAVRSIPDK